MISKGEGSEPTSSSFFFVELEASFLGSIFNGSSAGGEIEDFHIFLQDSGKTMKLSLIRVVYFAFPKVS